MPTLDRRVDEYIAKSAGFARPILKELRKQVHHGCPAAVETIKWRMPWFDYKGLLCGMAAFKSHCAFVFWRDVKDVVSKPKSAEAMGQLGRIADRSDLPPQGILTSYVRAAVARRDSDPTERRPRRAPSRDPAVPAALRQALAGNPAAWKTFRAFPPSHRRAYTEWIAGAKRPETRKRRLATALDWLADGKPQNWRSQP
jgi:uncharacterized protein YdeI (YjbR/CyaY-like superfamily)